MARLLLDAGATPLTRNPSARAISVQGLNFAPQDTMLLMHTSSAVLIP